ncbi:5' nucleotidase family-domain-containing protein [Kickxella alabastrina]|uniref:5' nucleotidase family-domain-containing protein n=1 Tax=Kickxella alabastrina TaxID=61397 RepID=UPI002220F807|nr:5' nucleotidase family-domain-containing protein [Kickxella alabastrina]KAI7828340.1 5' nucleotidase family-domain-containing protein [Kickxella alabastrina]
MLRLPSARNAVISNGRRSCPFPIGNLALTLTQKPATNSKRVSHYSTRCADENGAHLPGIKDAIESNPYLRHLSSRYDMARKLCMEDSERFTTTHAHQRFQPSSQDIFPNTELRLSKVRTYGFDYDYTLARYTDKLPETIYTMIRDVLVNKLLYPPALKALKYDSTFAIRGISYDKETGWLFKLDSNYNIAMDTIHYGREPLRDLEEVYTLHNGPHVAPAYVKGQLNQLNDLYSIPEATMLADIIQYFTEHNIPFHPRYLAEDIRTAGEYIHKGDGISLSPLHKTIMSNIGDYLERAPELLQILESLKREGKRLFLLTNSGYDYVNTGLTYLFNTKDWRDVFDVVIVGARKPSWYMSHRPFRLVPTGRGGTSVKPWALVDHFEDGQVYSGGNLMSFTSITGYSDRNVMYFGDHLYSDLRDPSIQKGWMTGAIVSELKHELSVIHTPEYRQCVSYIQLIEKILKHSQQETRSPEFMRLPAEEKERFRQLLDVGRLERRRTRWRLRDSFNTNFGSVFRTEKYPSLFATKIKSFANVYTADLSNLGAYTSDFIFYPKRITQAHESRLPEVDDLLEDILNS